MYIDKCKRKIEKTILYIFSRQYRLIKKADLFDSSFYLEQNYDIRISGMNPLLHYVRFGFREGRNPNPLFDTSYYMKQNPDILESGVNPLVHYLENGAREGTSPHPLFDSSYYLDENPDVLESGINPLVHYIECGAKEERNPSVLFDISYYIAQNPDVLESGINPLVHYLECGAREGANPHPLFDSSYYLNENTDVLESGIDPLVHYLVSGAREGRNPNPLFDTSHYLAQNPGLFETGINPLVHYFEIGVREGKNPHPLFDSSYYLDKNPDVLESGMNPLVHYLESEAREGENPHPLFDSSYYLDENPDVLESGVNPLVHYLENGTREETGPHPLFDSSYYLNENPDVLESGMNPLVHYIECGAKEERNPSVLFDISYYIAQNPDVLESGINPLVHYLECGAKEGANPHPLFDSSYYLNENPDVLESGINPLVHYVRFGAREGRNTIRLIENIAYTPKISIITVICCMNKLLVNKYICSLVNQSYDNWELTILCDANSNVHIKTILEGHKKKGQSIQIKCLKQNQSFTEITNEAIRWSTGEFLGFYQGNNEITPNSLHEIVKVLNEHPDTDLIYSDHDEVTQNGYKFSSVFKPDWSPELFKSIMYTGDQFLVRKLLAEKVGLFNSKFDRIRYYEFILRFSEHTTKTYHIPRILYHSWHIKSPDNNYKDSNRNIKKLQAKAVNAHLNRLNLYGYAKNEDAPPYLHIYPKKRKDLPLVSVIIPVVDSCIFLEQCLNSTFHLTSYPNFEVILVVSNAAERDNFKWMGRYPLKKVSLDGIFSYSSAYNLGANTGRGEYVVFLQNEMEIITPDWIQNLLYYLDQPDIGTVAPFIISPNGNEKGAYTLTKNYFGREIRHITLPFLSNSENYYNSLCCTREVSAVSTAGMMIRKSLFSEMGGFNIHYRSHYHDVDLCLKLRKQGYRIILARTATLRHYEHPVKDKKHDLVDKALMLDQWEDVIAAGDPYFRTNYDLTQYSDIARLKSLH